MFVDKDINVGKQIKGLRKQKGWTLRELAKRCGLSANGISLIEREENSPTVSSLRRLAAAFNVPISGFFQEEHDETCAYVKNEQGMRIQNEDVVLESLGFGLQNQQLEPFRMTIEPHAEALCGVINHPGQEFVYCLWGQIEYRVEDDTYLLEPGDSLLFNALCKHSWRNETSEPVMILLVFQADRDTHLAKKRHLEIKE